MGLFRRRSHAALTKAAERRGVMVTLYPSREVAEAIAQPAGEPVEELHLTLAYLGKADDLEDAERLAAAVAGVAAATPPLEGLIAGTGRFTAGPEPVTYASPDVPGLPELRQRLCEALGAAGFELPSEHGFTPHITLAYADIDPQIPNLDLTFDALTLVIAGERQTFPLTGVAKEDDVTKAATGDFEARWSKDGQRELTVPLWKNDEKQIVYGVVMQPDVADSQGDTVDAAEIEKAAHRYLAESRKHDVQHEEEQVEAVPVESFIAHTDMEYAGRPVLKGSWVMAVHVPDAEVWGQVSKGELTGFSIGGTAERGA